MLVNSSLRDINDIKIPLWKIYNCPGLVKKTEPVPAVTLEGLLGEIYFEELVEIITKSEAIII